eukprot:scaffold43941_cov33-Tisochrysis_lutea.AAC.3
MAHLPPASLLAIAEPLLGRQDETLGGRLDRGVRVGHVADELLDLQDLQTEWWIHKLPRILQSPHLLLRRPVSTGRGSPDPPLIPDIAHDARRNANDLFHVRLGRRCEVPLASGNLEKLRVVVYETSRDDTLLERWVRQHVQQEGDVGLYATNPRLLQRAAHATIYFFPRRSASRVLNKERIIVWSHSHPRVANAVLRAANHLAHAISSRVTVDGEGSSIRSEVALGVLGRYTALDGDAARGNAVLFESATYADVMQMIECLHRMVHGHGGAPLYWGRGTVAERTCTRPTSSSEAPEAMRICACTRSMPVTSSVTVCST